MPQSALFINATPTTAIYTLSLHDALPISLVARDRSVDFEEKLTTRALDELVRGRLTYKLVRRRRQEGDRKSTRLNSSHTVISYAVFCLKKKKSTNRRTAGIGYCRCA